MDRRLRLEKLKEIHARHRQVRENQQEEESSSGDSDSALHAASEWDGNQNERSDGDLDLSIELGTRSFGRKLGGQGHGELDRH